MEERTHVSLADSLRRSFTRDTTLLGKGVESERTGAAGDRGARAAMAPSSWIARILARRCP